MTNKPSVKPGAHIRYTGAPENSGFETGEICVVTAVYESSIGARTASGANRQSYYISNGDYEVVTQQLVTTRDAIAALPETMMINGYQFTLLFLDCQTGDRYTRDRLADYHWNAKGTLKYLVVVYEAD